VVAVTSSWYAHYPKDFVEGVAGMKLEDIGAYAMVLNLIYLYDRPVRDNDHFISSMIGCHILKWRAIRRRLLASGKLIEIEGGYLDNPRATSERSARDLRLTHRRSAGHRGGIASGESRKNKALAEAHASKQQTTLHNNTIHNKEEEKNGAHAPTAYAWSGKIIRLNTNDYARWKQSFRQLDLDAELLAYDQYLVEQRVKGNWFARTSKYLANRNMEAKAKGKSRSPPDVEYFGGIAIKDNP
jgi:uncharacterized protein YdaU (DUF1376 family)